jgi:uncharacterized damage-inducible protein DinB
MDKLTFLGTIKSTRYDFESALRRLNDDQMSQPGVSGDLSVKDIIAHVTWYEREMIGLLQGHALAGSDLWGLSPAERNAAILAANRDRALAEVRAEARQVYLQLIELLERTDADVLKNPAHFRDMPRDWVPWQVIAGNSSEHYADHAADIRAWLETEGE